MKGVKKWDREYKKIYFSLVVFGYEWKIRGMENCIFIWLRRKMR